MKIKAIKTVIFKPQDNLLNFIEKYFPVFKENSILVITSKIVALSEGRLVKYIDAKNKLKIIKQESDVVIKTKYVYLTIKDGEAMANAGIDESNADGHLILLPTDSFKSAAKIRKYFCTKHKLKNFGVIITDSRCLPLRAGVVGVAIGYAGFEGLKKYQGKVDIFKRPFVYERIDVVDSLATAAVLCMGEGDEKKPLALINEAPVKYNQRVNRKELKIDIKEDMYGPLFRRIK